MPVIRLKEAGWEAFSGLLGDTEFVGGVSVENVSNREADRLACLMKVENVETGENPSSTQHMVEERNYTAEQMEEARKARERREAKIQAEKDRVNKELNDKIAEYYQEKRQSESEEEQLEFEFVGESDEVPVVAEVSTSDTLEIDTDDLPEEDIQYSYTLEQLEEIADRDGLSGLRDFANQYDVRGKSIASIIKSLMAIKEDHQSE